MWGQARGSTCDRWKRLGARVTGLDLTDIAVDELTRCFPDNRFVRADIGGPRDQIALRASSFDAVSAFDVLFHIVDDVEYGRAFANIAQLLRPGGWFVWSDNFLRHPTERAAHQVSRSLAESTRLVEAAGLTVVDRVPMFVLMNYPADTSLRRWPAGAWGPRWRGAVMLGEPLGWALGAALYPPGKGGATQKRRKPQN